MVFEEELCMDVVVVMMVLEKEMRLAFVGVVLALSWQNAWYTGHHHRAEFFR